jgi:hypothetical protein
VDASESNPRNVRLVEELVAAFPQFSPLLDEHRAYYSEIIPHNFMAEVTRQVIETYVHRTQDIRAAEELARLFEFLEAKFDNGDKATRELLTDSFIEHLPYPWEHGWEPGAEDIRAMLGPAMRGEMERRLGSPPRG